MRGARARCASAVRVTAGAERLANERQAKLAHEAKRQKEMLVEEEKRAKAEK